MDYLGHAPVNCTHLPHEKPFAGCVQVRDGPHYLTCLHRQRSLACLGEILHSGV